MRRSQRSVSRRGQALDVEVGARWQPGEFDGSWGPQLLACCVDSSRRADKQLAGDGSHCRGSSTTIVSQKVTPRSRLRLTLLGGGTC